ncbi:biogenesis of lysosome-related organelles complex 1 subunit 3 [Anabrus simplex]|uniref:biogenesis of lysosome-related organelles complex 1 subunit 3 n=1 Tax=Anabrus simplex TaxID=316456 RepID=UPI0034DD59D6
MMERKQYVVIGEAPESDSEEEVNVSTGVSVLQNKQRCGNSNSQGIIVVGEAPESDEECEEDIVSVSSVSSAASVSSTPTLSASTKNKISENSKDGAKYNTLLHKKLRERNISLHRNISEFIHNTTAAAARELNTTNQQLLRSQVQLQEAATSLHVFQTHLQQLSSKLAAVRSMSYLPRIHIPPGI